MTTSDQQSPSAATWWQRIAYLPTRYHLFCAEHELRAVAADTLSPAQRRARQRNLARLRAYRAMGRFPQNTHTTKTFAPCFIDQGGRLCAVAYLMHDSGHAEATQHIARTTNYARIAQMDYAGLDAWAMESGLTKAEIARIQPSYPPIMEMISAQYNNITTTIMVVGAIGIFSIIANSFRLAWGYLQRFTVVAGVFLGIALLYLSRSASQVADTIADTVEGPLSVPFLRDDRAIASYIQSLHIYEICALIVGLSSIIVAFLRYRMHRRQDA